ncbi:inactive serine/threonine-protein kinase PLK5-like [Melopsittacus undulatus]|uniref:inactive serine/threonine-protein kinase PLK5-like n=1 Tax=Melopsittacus undulatus TaxID=13146 RepID=UPI00146BD97D|nr:inactive serine/threonine-protein kinase PLK5-like [Melopsittacus undulatus]
MGRCTSKESKRLLKQEVEKENCIQNPLTGASASLKQSSVMQLKQGHSKVSRRMALGCAGNEPPGWCIEDAGSGMLYRRGRLLGEGTFGHCYQLTEVASGRVYAAKVIPRAHLTAVGIRERVSPRRGDRMSQRREGSARRDPTESHSPALAPSPSSRLGDPWAAAGLLPMQVEQEQELHSRLHHRHIVCLHGHFADHHHVYLLLEYCSRRSLADILQVRGMLTEPEVRYYLLQVISGLRYLHGQGIIHRDLKLSNFLVTKKMQVKIGDLGLAQLKAPAALRWGALCGTPSFLAPKVLDRKGHGVPSDVWALGCAMYTALTGTPPFEAAQQQELYQHIQAARYPQPSQLSAHAQALIAHLLAPDAAARPSLQDVLDYSFFTQVWGRCRARPWWGWAWGSVPLAPQGFTPQRLPPRACHSVPIFLAQALRCRLRRWLCQEHRDHRSLCPMKEQDLSHANIRLGKPLLVLGTV